MPAETAVFVAWFAKLLKRDLASNGRGRQVHANGRNKSEDHDAARPTRMLAMEGVVRGV